MQFDLSKLKKRPSYPFETIAVAIAFSPRLETVISEAVQLSKAFNAHLLIFHIGKRTHQKEEQLEQVLRNLKVPLDTQRVIWMAGEPVETILKLCKLNVVDLLVLGALEKESLLKFYLSSVARSISRKAKCSVLLLTKESPNISKYRKIVVNGIASNPKTGHSINTAIYFSKHIPSKEIFIVQELHNPGLTLTISEGSTAPEANKIKKEFNEEEVTELKTLLENIEETPAKISEKVIHGKPGYSIRNFAESRNADLLVINSPDTNLNILDRIFTHDIEYILEDLPCNLLIVHSRV
jgi:nucleotide-binding universal stress UspA family protein